ncbi:MAG: 16S rRNA (uracil(1498)-N(3))-methyltransferase [Planctomycetes bacterium]|nr:16S rRNA (uracil(1498)-N(3))-methyltransferase [Planctomycetota bacterium]
MPRFLVPNLKPGGEVDLPPAEARHAARSRRLRSGASVILFDGAGTTCDGVVLRVHEGRVTVRVGTAHRSDEPRRILIASALPKGRRLPWMVQKLTELGVAEFIPLHFRRSVVRWSPSRARRLEKVVIESAKQSHRADLMKLGFEERVEQCAPRFLREGALFVTVPHAPDTLLRAARDVAGTITVVVGPEGGIDPRELETLGAAPVSLGRTILRVETAAVAAAAVLAQL